MAHRRRWRVWLLAVPLVMAACASRTATSPDDVIPFALPADAPRDAAAAPGTTRVTVTMIQITRDGDAATSSIPPDRLIRGERYRVRSWIYCPAGLDGFAEYRAWQVSPGVAGVFGVSTSIAPGYNYRDESLKYDYAVTLTYRFEVWKGNVSIASKEIVITIN